MATEQPTTLYRPPPAIIVDDFVGGAVARQLFAFALAHESDFRRSEVVLGNDAVIDVSRRVSMVNSDIAPILPLIEPVVKPAVDDAIRKLGLVNVDSYLLEMQLAWSGNGCFFKRHADSLFRDRGAHQRVLTMVHYFHAEPKAFTGGQLRLWGLGAEADKCIAEIDPQFDRAVFFPAWSPHEVMPVHCRSDAFADGRFAISCWVRKV